MYLRASFKDEFLSSTGFRLELDGGVHDDIVPREAVVLECITSAGNVEGALRLQVAEEARVLAVELVCKQGWASCNGSCMHVSKAGAYARQPASSSNNCSKSASRRLGPTRPTQN